MRRGPEDECPPVVSPDDSSQEPSEGEEGEIMVLPVAAPPEFSSLKRRRSSISRAVLLKIHRQLFQSPRKFLATINHEFSASFINFLFLSYFGIKGFAFCSCRRMLLPLLKEGLKVEAEIVAVANTIVSMPWAMKGLIGAISDSYALAGYHKRSWLAVVAFLGVFVTATLCIIPTYQLNWKSLTLLMAGISLYASFTDLLCEGAYTQRMRDKPHTGAALTSWVWLCITISGVAVAAWTGPMSDQFKRDTARLSITTSCFKKNCALFGCVILKQYSH
eukprot:GHVT01069601.1.p2 GENE.GHVT01069601.1~~GHVT01069601.1.p2  ORF type:complete len:276 (-),score=17.59 GHVT01069601.1:1430-2257(-)